jgi:hypothetical protein
MLSIRIWKQLQVPPVSAGLYRRALIDHFSADTLAVFKDKFAPYMPLLMIFGLVLFCCTVSSLNSMPYLSDLLSLATIAFFFGTSIPAFGWTLSIAQTIARQREQGMWPLLSIVPAGAFGAAWGIGVTLLDHDRQLNQHHRQHLMRLFGLLMLFILVLFNVLGSIYSLDDLVIHLGQLLLILVVIAASYIDFIHTTLIALASGLLAGVTTQNRVDAFARGLGLFALGQLATYLPSLVLLAVGARWVNQHVSNQAGPFVLPLVFLAVFALLREGVLYLYWNLLTRITNADSQESRGQLEHFT